MTKTTPLSVLYCLHSHRVDIFQLLNCTRRRNSARAAHSIADKVAGRLWFYNIEPMNGSLTEIETQMKP